MGATKQRAAVRNIIYNSPDHLSAEQIYSQAREQIPDIGLGTVYRNLNLLTENGEIRRVPIPNHSDRFDKNTSLHGHYYCLGCNKVFDIDMDNFALAMLTDSVGVKLLGYELIAFCLCQDCIANGKSAQSQPNLVNSSRLT